MFSGLGTVGAEGAKTPTDFEKYGENTKVQCKICGDKYPDNHMESHVVAVHGLDGPKEMYIDDQSSSFVRSVSGTHDSKSIPRPLVIDVSSDSDLESITSSGIERFLVQKEAYIKKLEENQQHEKGLTPRYGSHKSLFT